MNLRLPILLLCVLVLACQKKEEKKPVVETSEPQRVEIQHILIAFESSLPGKELDRTQAQAEELAQKIFLEAQSQPQNFEKLVVAHSDDMVPGVYRLANHGENLEKDEFARESFRKAFGNLAFQLEVGGVGLVLYDKENSPYGYHIIKRIR